MARKPAVEISSPAVAHANGPGHEYVRLQNSYLTEAQRSHVRDQIEALAHDREPTLQDYADLNRACLTAEQRSEIVTLLTALYVERGWLTMDS